MTIGPDSSLREVAFRVSTALDEAGTRAVLTGGGAAQIWAPTDLDSRDLDFILEFNSPGALDALESLGYEREADYYVHPANGLFLEFPRGPLSVGDDLVDEWDTLREEGRLLHVLSPTDSCRDRLAGYLYWADIGSLTQAAAVARSQSKRVDLTRIEDWCQRQGLVEKYRRFERAVASWDAP